MMSPEITGHNGINVKPYNKGEVRGNGLKRYDPHVAPQVVPWKIEVPKNNNGNGIELHINKVAAYNTQVKEGIDKRLNGNGPLELVGVLTPERIKEVLTPEEIKEANRLRREKEEYTSTVHLKTLKRSTEVAKKLSEIDSKTMRKNPTERAAARLAQFNEGIHWITDCDKTITQSDDLNTYIIPGSKYAESMLNKQRSNFEEVHSLIWQPAVEKNPDLFYEGGTKVELRYGVQAFVDKVKESGDEITIASANHMPFVEGVKSQIDGNKNIDVRAILPRDVRPLAKRTVVENVVFDSPSRNKDKAIILIGDGSSDSEFLKRPNNGNLKDIYTYIYALKGSTFANELRGRKIVHGEYRNFKDIIKQQNEIEQLAAKIKPHTAHKRS